MELPQRSVVVIFHGNRERPWQSRARPNSVALALESRAKQAKITTTDPSLVALAIAMQTCRSLLNLTAAPRALHAWWLFMSFWATATVRQHQAFFEDIVTLVSIEEFPMPFFGGTAS